MAEGYLKSLDPRLEVYSAGIHPAPAVHPYAIRVMEEIGIDISAQRPKLVSELLSRPFDWLITVCDDADRDCPMFPCPVPHRIHIGFEDPARASGSEEEILAVFRKVRDQIVVRFRELYETRLQTELKR